jgi:hypothetical protein
VLAILLLACTPKSDDPHYELDTADADTDTDADTDADTDTGTAPPTFVTLRFTGEVATVAGTPFGLDDSVRTTAVSGLLRYDLAVADQERSDPQRGTYDHTGSGAFATNVAGVSITGSGRPITEVEDFPGADTWRFIDGPQMGDETRRLMSVNGVADDTVELWIAISDSDLFASDVQPDPFPTLDIANTPHTFSLEDSGGTLLLQLDALTQE